MTVELLIVDPLVRSLKDGLSQSPGGGIMGIVGSLFGLGSSINPSSAAAGVPVSAIQGQYANGGSFSANRPMIVGERGPELLVPRNSGSIIPNNQLGGGSPSVSFNVTVNEGNSGAKAKVSEGPMFYDHELKAWVKGVVINLMANDQEFRGQMRQLG
jgi:hypothetical protein